MDLFDDKRTGSDSVARFSVRISSCSFHLLSQVVTKNFLRTVVTEHQSRLKTVNLIYNSKSLYPDHYLVDSFETTWRRNDGSVLSVFICLRRYTNRLEKFNIFYLVVFIRFLDLFYSLGKVYLRQCLFYYLIRLQLELSDSVTVFNPNKDIVF